MQVSKEPPVKGGMIEDCHRAVAAVERAQFRGMLIENHVYLYGIALVAILNAARLYYYNR
jgi:hypothetical protein